MSSTATPMASATFPRKKPFLLNSFSTVAARGSRSLAGSNATPLLTSRFMWMARFGMVNTGRPKSKSRLSGSMAVSPFKVTRPAQDRGRSIQVLWMRPP